MIASDKWIRQMALEQGMITPFVERLVTTGKVSYGLSSYGYDVRVGKKFKIFHNLNSTLIDPKAFDPRSFVDHEGDCIIPPNSFVLAETVERFKMPRNALAVCVGKCVTGDTRVVDAATGEYLPIESFAGRRRTVGLDGWRTRTLPVSDFIPQGVQPVYELRTRTGLRIRATASHPFRQLGGWTPLSDLRAGDRIAVVRQLPLFGRTPLPDWEAALLGLMLSDGQCHTPGASPTFTSCDPVLVDLLVESARGLGCEVSANGALGYRLVNRRGRGGRAERNRATCWLEGHGVAVKAAGKAVPQAVFRAPRSSVARFLQALFAGDGSAYASGEGVRLEYYSMSRRLVEDVHHLLLRFGIVSLIREKPTPAGVPAYRVQVTDRDMVWRFVQELGFWPGSRKQAALEALIPDLCAHGRAKSNFDTLPRTVSPLARGALVRAGLRATDVGLRGLPDGRQSVGLPAASAVALATRDPDLLGLVQGGPLWDTVESVLPAGEAPVYDLTVPGASNFVANGLFVHNSTYARCGIIVNVTPIEPEWEGVITIEISNTTPLPAKIYADEGIAQLLFFLGDQVCETSYADRKGKYQNQPGLTLPKILRGGAP